MKTKLITLYFILGAVLAFSQSSLSGKVTDAATKSSIIFGTVKLYQKDKLVAEIQSDLDGNYIFSSLTAGVYTIKAQQVGYDTTSLENIQVLPNKVNQLNIELTERFSSIEEVVIGYSNSDVHAKSTNKKPRQESTPLYDVKPKKSKSKHIKGKVAPKGEKLMIRGRRISGSKTRDGSTPSKEAPAHINGMAIYSDDFSEEESQEKIPAGQLTAGEWNDLDNWESWEELIAEDFEAWTKHWGIVPKQRYRVKISALNQRSLPNSTVQLLDSDNKVLWETKTDNQGIAELWANLFSDEDKPSKIIAKYKDMQMSLEQIKPFEKGVNTIHFPVGCVGANSVDIGFVVDATSSMLDELAYLKAELKDVIERIQRNNRSLYLRTGTVFYRDTEDDYITRINPLSENISNTIDFIQKQHAAGGGDLPEAVEQALEVAVNQLNWDATATARILFLILDASPHDTPETIKKMQALSRIAAQKGIKIIPVTGSGIQKDTEYLMKSIAMVTNSTYTFLTNDSGIGNPHLEVTAGVYEVKFLNDLMVDLVGRYTQFKDCEEIETQEPIAVLPLLNNNSALLQYLECYPNPATDFVTLRLQSKFDHLIIKNALGQQVASYQKLKPGEQTIPLGNWAPGFYFLEFRKGKDYVLEKLVVQSEK